MEGLSPYLRVHFELSSNKPEAVSLFSERSKTVKELLKSPITLVVVRAACPRNDEAAKSYRGHMPRVGHNPCNIGWKRRSEKAWKSSK